MKKVFSILAALLFLTAGSLTVADNDTAALTVIHGIPNLSDPVEVFANGGFLFSFDFNQSEELEVPADTYFIEVKLLGDVVLSGTATLEAGKNYTAIAHLTFDDDDKGVIKEDRDAGIKLSFFENNIGDLSRWAIRLTLRHTADAPEVDIALRRGYWGSWFFAKALGLSNNDSGEPSAFGPVDFWWGYFTAVIFPAGTDTEVFNSGRLYLSKGTSYIVYPIGSIFDGTFTLFVQTIDLRY